MKNISHEKVLKLKEEVEILSGQVVSKTLTQNEALNITLFAFDKNEEISTHQSEGDALVTVLEGTARITIEDTEYLLHSGESIVMPARKPHALCAIEPFKMMLVVVF